MSRPGMESRRLRSAFLWLRPTMRWPRLRRTRCGIGRFWRTRFHYGYGRARASALALFLCGGGGALDSGQDDATSTCDWIVGGGWAAAWVVERAGDEAVERGALRRDGEGLRQWSGDPERWASGARAGYFPAVCDGKELCVVARR